MKVKQLPLILLIVLLGLSAACNTADTGSPAISTPDETLESLYPAVSETLEIPTSYPIIEAPLDTESVYPVDETSVPAQPIAEFLPIQSLEMFADGQGWGLFNRYNLMHTSDSGLSWQEVTPQTSLIPEGEFGPSLDYFFLSGSTAWYMLWQFEEGTLFHTTDSGATWTEIGLGLPGKQLFFFDEVNGFLLSDLGVAAGSHYVALYSTSDAGLTWTMQFAHEPGLSKDLPEGGSKSGLSFLDINKGWIAGNAPIDRFIYLYQTINKGQNWEVVDVLLPDEISEVFFEAEPPIFFDNSAAILPVRALGESSDFSLLFFNSADAGESWQFASKIPAGTLYDFADASTGMAGGSNALFKTMDGAKTWQDISGSLSNGEYLIAVQVVSAETAWILTSPSPEDSNARHLYQTTDGGVSWNLLQAEVVYSEPN